MWVWIGEEILKNDKIFPISDIHNVRLNRRGYTYFRHGQNISYLDKHIVGWMDGRGCTIDITKYFLFKQTYCGVDSRGCTSSESSYLTECVNAFNNI